ncbi:unnamed protein product [Symbiodinium sp. CCMP2592]|nr:unnamed protein product [Symbiodinium sp. CCMP2592]
MPGPWTRFRKDADAWATWSPRAGEYFRVIACDPKNSAGQWLHTAMVAVSDEYLQWWLDADPGYTADSVHVCTKPYPAAGLTKEAKKAKPDRGPFGVGTKIQLGAR